MMNFYTLPGSVNKAHVLTIGNVRYLISYETFVAAIDGNGKLHRYWCGSSTTTSRHINLFLRDCYTGYTVKDWKALETETEEDKVLKEA